MRACTRWETPGAPHATTLPLSVGSLKLTVSFILSFFFKFRKTNNDVYFRLREKIIPNHWTNLSVQTGTSKPHGFDPVQVWGGRYQNDDHGPDDGTKN